MKPVAAVVATRSMPTSNARKTQGSVDFIFLVMTLPAGPDLVGSEIEQLPNANAEVPMLLNDFAV